MTDSVDDLGGVPTALVLGGGGVAGIAWMTGLCFGLEDGGVEASSFGVVVGTSAGAAVGAQITSGVPMADLFDRQVRSERQVAELMPEIQYLRLLARLLPGLPLLARRDPRAFRAYVGRVAVKTETVDAALRHAVIAERLPSHEWPDVLLRILAVDAQSGELKSFERDSGADLVDAVAASCAVPGVWPPVPIQGRTYIDGGAASPDNAAMASGCESVVVVSPMGGTRAGGLTKRVRREVSDLESTGSRVFVIVPDAASRAAIGRRALDPSRRPPAAHAGRAQGQVVASELKTWLASRPAGLNGNT